MGTQWRTAICALAALNPCLAAAPAAMQPPPTPTQELTWVGLFNGELVDWLENDNRLKELCTAREGSSEWQECQAAAREPKLTVIPVRSEPQGDARRLGEIVILALPGRGLKALASSGGMGAPFTPDLFDPDWGYGPWFHQSVLERRGSWFRVPVPAIGAGWINAEDWGERDRFPSDGAGVSTKAIQAGDIVTTPRGDMVVLGGESGVLRVRPEQGPDMWCDGGDPPPLAPWQEIRIPLEQLRDSRGHLLIRYKHTRGC